RRCASDAPWSFGLAGTASRQGAQPGLPNHRLGRLVHPHERARPCGCQHFRRANLQLFPAPSVGISSQYQGRRRTLMKKTALVLTTVGALGLGAVAAPSPAEARFRGFGPALAGGLIAGAVIGGL